MTVYFEDDWFEADELDPKQQKTINELRTALLNRDFSQAKQTLQASLQNNK